MTKKLHLFFVLMALTMALASSASATGEEILARTGQYTFFIQPNPCDNVTYYQKMVPCVVTEEISVPRLVMRRYPVPVPAMRRVPGVITETPVGCAPGVGECATCYPRPSSRPGYKEIWGPKMVTVPVPFWEFTPKTVTHPVLLPQWFAVTDPPGQPRKVRKVGVGG